jgi:hypothetical protein
MKTNKNTTKMKTSLKLAAYGVAAMMAFIACKKDKQEEPKPNNPAPQPNPTEVITTMKIILRDSITGNEITGSPFIFKDADGDGGNAGAFLPTAADSIINLDANKTYLAEIILLDETKNPADSISNEVVEEGAEHMFFFEQVDPSGTPYQLTIPGSDAKITYLDLDANNRGIGQQFKIRANSATTNQLPFRVTLKHQPDVKNGSFAPGDTDVEVKFKLKVN